jgi:hypothetical protein
MELKIWRQGGANPAPSGLDQLADYLDRLSLEKGYLVIFDQRANRRIEAQPPEIVDHRGKTLEIWTF